ncbi:MAG: hypothetical protein J7559_23295, partial [Cohnella sp.]|nr:hypothetical protein [Cohnella sp.]
DKVDVVFNGNAEILVVKGLLEVIYPDEMRRTQTGPVSECIENGGEHWIKEEQTVQSDGRYNKH